MTTIALPSRSLILPRVEFPTWFAANDLSALGMPYAPLMNSNTLAEAGKAWAK